MHRILPHISFTNPPPIDLGMIILVLKIMLDSCKPTAQRPQQLHLMPGTAVLFRAPHTKIFIENSGKIIGFCVKRGLASVLPLFQHGLMIGSSEVREEAANGLGDLVSLTSEAALSPFVIKITGPLIRIVGDRFPPAVKAAILHTLRKLIEKAKKFLKPFLPQLQTTFMKALQARLSDFYSPTSRMTALLCSGCICRSQVPCRPCYWKTHDTFSVSSDVLCCVCQINHFTIS